MEGELKVDLEPKEWLKCMEENVLGCLPKEKHAALKSAQVGLFANHFLSDQVNCSLGSSELHLGRLESIFSLL